MCFAGAYWTADQDDWESVHETLGYTTSGLVVFRILWGFWGTRYVRFAHSLQRPAAVARYLAQMPYGWSKRYVGQSPASAISVIVFLALALVLCISGWAQEISTPSTDFVARLHEVTADTVIAFIGLHITFLLFNSWRSGENLLMSLLTGIKSGAPSEAIPSARHGVAVLLLAAVLGFWLYQWNNFAGDVRVKDNPTPVVQKDLRSEDVTHPTNHLHAYPAC